MYTLDVIERVWKLTKLGDKSDNRYGHLLKQAFSTPRHQLMASSFVVNKKNGGQRKIVPAGPILRPIHFVLYRWLSKKFNRTHDICYTGKSVPAALRPHLGATNGVTLDLTSAFDHVTRPRVQWMLRKKCLRESSEVLDAISYLLTCSVYPGREESTPQGCVSTPAAFNGVLEDVDLQLEKMARNYRLKWNRYSDNLIITGVDAFDHKLIVKMVKAYMAGAGFEVGRIEYFSEMPIQFLGAEIYTNKISVDPNKLGYYADMFLEAIQSPNPCDYAKVVNGMWSWIRTLSWPLPPSDMKRLYDRFKEVCRQDKTGQFRLL